MDKEVKKFKEDYKDIKSRIKLFKSKHRELNKEFKGLKREAKTIADKACALYNRGLNTMYMKVEGSDIDWKPKFSGLGSMLDNLEHIMCIDDDIQSIDEEKMFKA